MNAKLATPFVIHANNLNSIIEDNTLMPSTVSPHPFSSANDQCRPGTSPRDMEQEILIEQEQYLRNLSNRTRYGSTSQSKEMKHGQQTTSSQ
ncbi:conserved hypothetical protein [Halomonas sp. 59]|nr:conserved hypothetical protein [Halomonas sp. 59]